MMVPTYSIFSPSSSRPSEMPSLSEMALQAKLPPAFDLPGARGDLLVLGREPLRGTEEDDLDVLHPASPEGVSCVHEAREGLLPVRCSDYHE